MQCARPAPRCRRPPSAALCTRRRRSRGRPRCRAPSLQGGGEGGEFDLAGCQRAGAWVVPGSLEFGQHSPACRPAQVSCSLACTGRAGQGSAALVQPARRSQQFDPPTRLSAKPPPCRPIPSNPLTCVEALHLGNEVAHPCGQNHLLAPPLQQAVQQTEQHVCGHQNAEGMEERASAGVPGPLVASSLLKLSTAQHTTAQRRNRGKQQDTAQVSCRAHTCSAACQWLYTEW